MSLSSTLKVSISSTQTEDLDLSTPSDGLNDNNSTSLADGTGADQANKQWHDSRSLSSGASEDLDMSGTLEDAFGGSVIFSAIKAISIRNTSTDSTLIVGGATAAITSLFADTTDKLIVRPGGRVYFEAPDVDGYAVTAGSADDLKMEHGAEGSSDLVYEIIVIGVSS